MNNESARVCHRLGRIHYMEGSSQHMVGTTLFLLDIKLGLCLSHHATHGGRTVLRANHENIAFFDHYEVLKPIDNSNMVLRHTDDIAVAIRQ